MSSNLTFLGTYLSVLEHMEGYNQVTNNAVYEALCKVIEQNEEILKLLKEDK